MNKSFLVKSFTAVVATTFLVSAFTYSIVRNDEPQTIDFSAFKNAAANIEYISQANENKPSAAVTDITGSIVKTIEKEVRGKIIHSRYAFTAKPKTVAPVQVIAKNWNDIKPEFAAVDMKLDDVKLASVSSTTNEVSEFEINNKELIKLYGFETESLQYETFANTQIASFEAPVLDVIKEDAVQVAQASTTTTEAEVSTAVPAAPPVETQEEIAQAEIATKANPVNDDLVVYDYSADKKQQRQQ